MSESIRAKAYHRGLTTGLERAAKYIEHLADGQNMMWHIHAEQLPGLARDIRAMVNDAPRTRADEGTGAK